jgi:hypothetical protein
MAWPLPPESALAAVFPELDPGEPDAPAWPSGAAAKLPRRLPGGGLGGAPQAGSKFSAMTRPRDAKPSAEDPAPESNGGGGTRRGAPMPADRDPAMLRCSATGSRGAGAITELWLMLSSPGGRLDAVSTLGGGAMTAGCGAWNAATVEVRKSGGGATTELCSGADFRPWMR